MKKTLITLFFALVASAGTLLAQSGTCGDNLTWTLNNGTLTISGTGTMADYTDSNRAPWCDYRSSITKVVINSGVTSIGEWAFSDCTGLTSVTIPNSVTSIGKCAFYGCSSLTSITIPNSVTSIGEYTFYKCISLTSVTIPSSVTSIGEEAFYDVPNIVYSGTATGAPWGARSLNGYVEGNLVYRDATKTELLACFATATGEITIPSSVTSIGTRAFFECRNLTSITIPNSVTSIGKCAFYGCSSLTSITIPNSVTSIGFEAFGLCSSLTSVTIPNSVTSIGSYAFCDCISLTSVTIPKSVTSIGQNAFFDCRSLTSITIPNSVTSIGEWAFSYCSSLTSVTIPNSVTSIGEYAFYNVPNIVYSGTATGAPWGARSLNGYVEGNLVYRDATKTELLACFAAATGEITIPNSVTSIGNYAFCHCSSLTSITIPNSVTSIGQNAFFDCRSLTSITIPNSVTSIGEWAFSYCSSLTSITIPKSVRTIGDRAFDNVLNIVYNGTATGAPWGARSLNGYVEGNLVYRDATKTELLACSAAATGEITIPNSVTSIGEKAFSGCSSLTSITIPNSVTSIGRYAFWGCTGLTSITIPNSVTSIENYAFSYCSSLTSVTCYAKNPPTLGSYAFYEIFQDAILYVPADAISAYEANEEWKSSFADVRPIGASGTETDQVKVEPAETTATVAWPTINGAGSYELVIRDKDGNALCTLVFNAQGQLTSIDFAAAPARDRSNIAAKAQGAGFAFTVTGLESGTTYSYTLKTKNASGAVIDTKTGAFTTTGESVPTDIDEVPTDQVPCTKVIREGQILILRDGKVYNATGAEVK